MKDLIFGMSQTLFRRAASVADSKSVLATLTHCIWILILVILYLNQYLDRFSYL